MEQTIQLRKKSVGYYFLRCKDVHIENGEEVVTFFARLTREISLDHGDSNDSCVQTVWVKIDEIPLAQASPKISEMPNCMLRYEVSQSVFYSLYQLSKSCPKELFYITPFHRNSTREDFIS